MQSMQQERRNPFFKISFKLLNVSAYEYIIFFITREENTREYKTGTDVHTPENTEINQTICMNLEIKKKHK